MKYSNSADFVNNYYYSYFNYPVVIVICGFLIGFAEFAMKVNFQRIMLVFKSCFIRFLLILG